MPSTILSGALVHIAPSPEKELKEYTVDIIAVPGLGGDPAKSFIHEESEFDWLKDQKEGILSEFKSARILKFAYESRWLGDKALNQTLGNVAEQLLVALVEARKGYEIPRPIIFLAHSMGGLVVAKALTIASSFPEQIDRMRIYECFAGGIFFGTPFGGSEEAAKAVVLASFLQPTSKGLPSQMLYALDPRGELLLELRNEFSQLVQKEPKAGIACITEQVATNYAKPLGSFLPKLAKLEKIVVTEASATLDGAKKAAFACDHRQLNRFINGKDPRFNVVKEMLGNIERDAHRIVKRRLNASMRSVVDDATFSGLSDSLNIIQPQTRRRRLETESESSTWILKEAAFEDWLPWQFQDESNNFLWVSGDEGAGKSQAALAAVEELEKKEITERRNESESMVAYFFCDATADSQNAESMLSSLMWQLILKRRSLGQYVRSFAVPKSAKSASMHNSIGISKLWTGLQDMLRDDSAPTVYFVVNNLHYLAEDNESTNEFWGKIKDLVTGETGPEDPIRKNVKWMFLSRPRENIRNVLEYANEGMVPCVDLKDGTRNQALRHELKKFTHKRVKILARIKKYSLALQYFVTSVLLERAENNKLWVEVTLEALPKSVESLISRVWEQSLDPKTDTFLTTKEILRTLAVVFEYPTLDELRVLAELGDEFTPAQIEEQVNACGPLLRVYEDGFEGGYPGDRRVTFIHDTAKDALMKESKSRTLIGFSDSADHTDQTKIKVQHGIVALRCFSYANQESEQDDAYLFQSHVDEVPEGEKIQDDAPELKGLFPEVVIEEQEVDEEDDDDVETPLNYPVKYWLRHGYEATPDFVDTLDLKNTFWASESSARQRWWSSYARGDVAEGLKNLTSMHVAAYFGLVPLIDSLLAEGHEGEIKVRDNWDNQPLHWAAARGHVAAMERLIDHGADINDGQQDHVWTPLHMAASEGRIKAMELLINGIHGKSANLDVIDKDIGTAVTLALAYNQDNAVKLLLDSGASPTLTAEVGESPVAMAAYMGEEELIQVLLEKGGDSNLGSHRFGSGGALAAAASAGHINIVNILGPYSNEEACDGALKEATRRGFHQIVELLLESVEHLVCDDDFRLAASMGHDLVLKALWNHNLNHSKSVISHSTVNDALYLAAEAEQETTVELLLETCEADPNAALGPQYGNAMTAAAYDGNVKILSKLLDFGTDVNATSGHPLQLAASQGHLDAVKLLLNHHASLDTQHPVSPEFPDGTALQAACAARQTVIASELLRSGANPNLGSGSLTNPLIAATTNGLGDLAVLLLQKGAHPNVPGGADGSLPLINAAATLSSNYLAEMIRLGASVNGVDPDGDTALIISAMYGDIDCVKILLENDANTNLCGDHFGTALHVAAQDGYDEICLLLLEHGANPSIRGGPYDTVVQAAAYSGEQKCMKVLLDEKKAWSKTIDVNCQKGKCFTALHAAVVNREDGPLRLLLERKPNLNMVPATSTTALYAAVFAGSQRNARLLLEAGANPNTDRGTRGTVLQAAALKCGPEMCSLLIEEYGAKDDWYGKYGSALVAATVRDFHEDETDVLEYLLEQDLTTQAYQAALNTAFVLQRKDAFKLIYLSIKSKDQKKFGLNPRKLLAGFRVRAAKRNNKAVEQEKNNNDFSDDLEYYYQDIDDEEEIDNGDMYADREIDNPNVDATERQGNMYQTNDRSQNAGATGTLPRELPNRSRDTDARESTGTARPADNAGNSRNRNLGAEEARNDPRSVGNDNENQGYEPKTATRDVNAGGAGGRETRDEYGRGGNTREVADEDGSRSTQTRDVGNSFAKNSAGEDDYTGNRDARNRQTGSGYQRSRNRNADNGYSRDGAEGDDYTEDGNARNMPSENDNTRNRNSGARDPNAGYDEDEQAQGDFLQDDPEEDMPAAEDPEEERRKEEERLDEKRLEEERLEEERLEEERLEEESFEEERRAEEEDE
ncbi:uncharacterized protein RCO7_03554 [Rhynchosporium graminicola]|uniref:Nephrocystin 3-like N-terminal domain-containing protein n=1 Tax=Rhynchosporium graminicola TaxID=2792576 RepID=A0A1E1LK46_9HELO|nr:uncharacterized protein RCO7_03554 [Rhynchosporium commune]